MELTNVYRLCLFLSAFMLAIVVGLALFMPDPPSPTRMTPATAHITTHNTPDGRCHEDDPCWLAR